MFLHAEPDEVSGPQLNLTKAGFYFQAPITEHSFKGKSFLICSFQEFNLFLMFGTLIATLLENLILCVAHRDLV